MKILFLSHRIPYPPDKGDKIRSYHELRWLAARHDVDLITTVDDEADWRHVPAVTAIVRRATIVPLTRAAAAWRAFRALAGRHALTEEWFSPPQLRRAVARAVTDDRYDVVFVYSSAHARIALDAGVPAVLDFVDVDSSKWTEYARMRAPLSPRRVVDALEGRRMRALEKDTSERAAATIVCAPREVDALCAFAKPRRLELIRNGTDTTAFSPRPEVAREPLVVFSGAMDYRANVDAATWFAHAVWPFVRARRKDARFAVVGSNPTSAVRALAAEANVEVTGRVDDVASWLRRASVAVAPLRVARGIQNKVLEALACATPVVATPAALEGIPGVVGAVAAKTPRELADAVVGLLDDAARARDLGALGRAYVEREGSWQTQLERLEAVLADAASSRTRS